MLSQQSKGLSAAADYLACRSTVAELLQRVNSQKASTSAAGVPPLAARTSHQVVTAAAGAAGAGLHAAAAVLATGDTSFSRDGRPAAAAGQLLSSGSGKVSGSLMLACFGAASGLTQGVDSGVQQVLAVVTASGRVCFGALLLPMCWGAAAAKELANSINCFSFVIMAKFHCCSLVCCSNLLQVAASRHLLGIAGAPSAERCSSLKAYQAFQFGRNLSSNSSLSGSSNSSNRQGLVKSISSGPSIMASHLHINSSALELRATAALRKCGSSKQ